MASHINTIFYRHFLRDCREFKIQQKNTRKHWRMGCERSKKNTQTPKNTNAINFLSQMERIKMYFLIINFNLKAQK